jgi:hypothetical protein
MASLAPTAIGYLLPSFTLKRKEQGSGFEMYQDSHSAVVNPPKMKPAVVLMMIRLHPLLSQHLWKSYRFHPSVLAS